MFQHVPVIRCGTYSKAFKGRRHLLDVYKRQVLTGVTEASSVGNLLCQLYGEGLLKSRKDVKDILKRTYPLTTYMPKDTGKWKEKFEDFMRDAYEPLNVCSGRKFWKEF